MSIDPARAAAWEALARFEHGESTTVVDAVDALADRLDPRDAALARELALGAVRHHRLYDALAARFLRPGQQPVVLEWALRLACHQLFALDRIPPHAACSSAVELLHHEGQPRLTGVANAVVRKLAALRQEQRDGDGPLGRLAPADRPRDPGVRHSLPAALVDDLRPLLDGRDLDAALAALNQVPPLTTRQRPGRPLAQGRTVVRSDGPWRWWDDAQEALRGPVADGLCAVQDRSQGVPVEIARPRPGEWVLDLCSAPGGKALALADLGCRVVAADIAVDRLRDVHAPAGAPTRLLAQDGRRPALPARFFDLVLLDAPCSNTGVLARRPEARLRYDRAHLAELTALQRGLLASAADLVAPDGRLVYATCSLSPHENQAITHALPGWRILSEVTTWPDGWQAGGYAALMVRNG